MAVLSKKLIRSLPTLTEVVRESPPGPLEAAPPAAQVLDEEALVERVLARLALSIESQVQAVIAGAVQEQMKELAPRIRQRVDNAVRKAAAQAVADEMRQNHPPDTR